MAISGRYFVCPVPRKWNEIYSVLVEAAAEIYPGAPRPPVPLILAGWWASCDSDKRDRWFETLRWAEEHGLAHLVPALTPDEEYRVDELSLVSDADHWAVWSHERHQPAPKPSAAAVSKALAGLHARWPEIAGPVAAATTALRLTGRKRRRLVVVVWDREAQPPWGSWWSRGTGPQRLRFSQFRRAVNSAIVPHSVDHIDFLLAVPRPTSSVEQVAWEDVAVAARLAFSLWDGAPELRWAERAWRILRRGGLTAYSGELERHRVLLRLLALGGIYADFCTHTWAVPDSREYACWAEPLRLDPLVLGRLYQQLGSDGVEDDTDPWEALGPLVKRERGLVGQALLDGMGGEACLFASLWGSREAPPDGDDEDEGGAPWKPSSAFRSPDAERIRGYEWVAGGHWRG